VDGFSSPFDLILGKIRQILLEGYAVHAITSAHLPGTSLALVCQRLRLASEASAADWQNRLLVYGTKLTNRTTGIRLRFGSGSTATLEPFDCHIETPNRECSTRK
jgi:hypothetical protein